MAIITPFVLYEFPVLNFGLCGASQTFQRFINKILQEFDFVFLFIDDILVASKSHTEYREHFEKIFKRFVEYGITINEAKYEFGVSEITFLGCLINHFGFRPLKERIEAIINFPKPKTIEQLRRFLGMINFYHRLIPKMAEFRSPLNKYLAGAKKRDKTRIRWTNEAESHFIRAKNDIDEETLL